MKRAVNLSLRKPAGGGELALIERIRLRAARLPANPAVRVGIGDDCAILAPPPGSELCVTTDFSLEGRHFRRDWHPAASIGHRALARGLSDLAAMGAEPLAAFLSLALPKIVARDTRWVDGFLDGLLALAAVHGITLAGGDTSEAPGEAVLVDIVLMGATPAGAALRRSGARAGDSIFVTGTLGGAAEELRQLSLRPEMFVTAKQSGTKFPHLFPQPRVEVGVALRQRGLVTACIDLSDGLSTDLAHLCAASGVEAMIDAAALPLAASLRMVEKDRARQCALHGGEDYELLFTAPKNVMMPKKIAGVRLTRIGIMRRMAKRRSQVVLVDKGGGEEPLLPGGWEHLR